METTTKVLSSLRILLVEDNPGDVYIIKDSIQSKNSEISVTDTSTLRDAIKLSSENRFDVILLDLGLPDSIGLDTLRKILAAKISAPVIVMTGMDDEEKALTSVKEGAQDYLVKNNLTSENILRAVRYGIERKKIQEELQKLNVELDSKIQIRTQELAEINKLLHIELDEHIRTSAKLKESEEKYKLLSDNLIELNTTKDKFFGIIAHDLKNPFSGILSMSEVLINYIDQFDLDNIKNISLLLNDSAKRGYALLENLLEWSRSQTGTIKFNPQQLNVRELVKENISSMNPIAVHKEIDLSTDISENIEITADKEMINTILRNLISNSIKFTNKNGKILVSAKKSDGYVTISVKDTGIGISSQDLDKLFRIDVSNTKAGTAHEKGTGLGLLICKEFVEKHGGKIWVDSILGQGSDFQFTISNAI